MVKKYHVSCVSPPELCSGEIYLGRAEFNQGLKCPQCGRWTKPGRVKPKDYKGESVSGNTYYHKLKGEIQT